MKLFTIGTDTAKQMIYARLRIHQPGAGYCHFPAEYSEEYFRQLTSERVQTRFVNGHPTRQWVLAKGHRNEALYCRVYALAALYILNPNLDALVQEMERERLSQKKPEPAKPEQGDGWIGFDDWNFN